MSKAELLEQIHKLPPEEQRELAETVLEGLEPESPEFIAELEARAEDARRDLSDAIPWEQVRDDVRKKYGSS